MKKPEVLEVRVTLELPSWFPQERFNYQRPVYYPPRHVYAGSYDYTVDGNSAEDNFWKALLPKTMCLDPQGKWAEFLVEDEPEKIAESIERLRERVRRYLSRYKEAKTT